MSALEVFAFPATGLPGKAKFGGYVYVVEFDTGLVKVGATTRPQHRVCVHEQQGAAFGTRAVRGWLSPLHDNYFRTEALLIEAAAALGGQAMRREYFSGADFDQLVDRASGFDFPPVDIAAAEARLNASLEFLKAPIRECLERIEAAEKSPETMSARLISDGVAAMFGRVGGALHIPHQQAEPISDDLIARLARAMGCDVEDVLDMDYIDLLKSRAIALVREHAALTREHAITDGREDLLLPLREVRLPDPDPNGGTDPFTHLAPAPEAAA